MKTFPTLAFVALAIAASTYAGAARAQIVEYTSQAAFEAAVTTFQNITFEGYDNSGSGYTIYNGTNSFGSALNFTDAFPGGGGANYAVMDGFSPNYNDLSTSLVPDGHGSEIVAPVVDGVTALGAQIFSGSASTATDTVDVFLAGNTSGTPDATFQVSAAAVDNSAPTSFIGFTTATGSIGSIVFEVNSTQNALPMDNVEYGVLNPSEVPEPSTYALMLGGLGILAFRGFRWMRNS